MDELKLWTVDMDVSFRARNENQAMAIAHVIADEIERKVQHSEVTLGENYRAEPIRQFREGIDETHKR